MQKMWETRVWSLGLEDPLELEMAAQSSILPGKFPWTEEPGGLHSTRLQRVGHKCAHTQWFVECMNNCTQIKAGSLWGSREGQGVGCRSWGCKEANTTVLTHKMNLRLWIPILLKDEELHSHIICLWNVLSWIIYWVGQKVWVFP